jgi:hypothetical protein
VFPQYISVKLVINRFISDLLIQIRLTVDVLPRRASNEGKSQRARFWEDDKCLSCAA